ncbi:MAG: EamA family transporter RarD, partial [Anaerolineales bacterium]|nr:EamA family transporter RarD [Anaerolineales bacterium]
MNKGIIYAAGAYVMWGLLPLYWKTLQEVPAGQILAHRIAWSLLFVGLVLTARHNWGWLHGALRRPRIVLTFLLSGILLGI